MALGGERALHRCYQKDVWNNVLVDRAGLTFLSLEARLCGTIHVW